MPIPLKRSGVRKLRGPQTDAFLNCVCVCALCLDNSLNLTHVPQILGASCIPESTVMVKPTLIIFINTALKMQVRILTAHVFRVYVCHLTERQSIEQFYRRM